MTMSQQLPEVELGPMSQPLNGLGAGRIARFDVVKDAQLVLKLPIPVEMQGH